MTKEDSRFFPSFFLSFCFLLCCLVFESHLEYFFLSGVISFFSVFFRPRSFLRCSSFFWFPPVCFRHRDSERVLSNTADRNRLQASALEAAAQQRKRKKHKHAAVTDTDDVASALGGGVGQHATLSNVGTWDD